MNTLSIRSITGKSVVGCAVLLFLLSLTVLPVKVASAAALGCGSWSIVPSPGANSNYNALSSVAAVSVSDAWAVGSYSNPNSGVQQNLTEQWNGTSWNVVSGPNAGSSSNYLFSVATVPGSGNLWTVGNSQLSDGTVQTLTASYC